VTQRSIWLFWTDVVDVLKSKIIELVTDCLRRFDQQVCALNSFRSSHFKADTFLASAESYESYQQSLFEYWSTHAQWFTALTDYLTQSKVANATGTLY
jgi:hypothetical protein